MPEMRRVGVRSDQGASLRSYNCNSRSAYSFGLLGIPLDSSRLLSDFHSLPLTSTEPSPSLPLSFTLHICFRCCRLHSALIALISISEHLASWAHLGKVKIIYNLLKHFLTFYIDRPARSDSNHWLLLLAIAWPLLPVRFSLAAFLVASFCPFLSFCLFLLAIHLPLPDRFPPTASPSHWPGVPSSS